MADNPFVAPASNGSPVVDRLFHFFVDRNGEETGESEEIRLAPDGSADLSSMRDQRRAETWKAFGVRDPHGFFRVFPSQGETFLEALLQMNNQNWRFRRTA